MTDPYAPELEKIKDVAARDGDGTLSATVREHWKRQCDAAFRADSDGLEVSRQLAAAMDALVAALCDGCVPQSVAVLAIGGYGRGQLAPLSDIDILILSPEELPTATLNRFLYGMWDAGIVVSQMAHTPASAMQAADEDIVTCTTLLDSRFLWGDATVADEFHTAFDVRRRKTMAEFAEAKLSEQSSRHTGAGLPIEPDIKNGPGGLRDLDTLHWLDRYYTGLSSEPSMQVETAALFTSGEERRLQRLIRFFWTVRVHLHTITGRADETLYVGLQQKIAARLGFVSRGGETAVERFMRLYMLNAKEVIRLTSVACQHIDRLIQRQSGLGNRVMTIVEAVTQQHPFDGHPALVLRGDLVGFVDPDVSIEKPEHLFAIFASAARTDQEVDPDALACVRRGMRSFLPDDLDRTEGLNDLFVAVLLESSRPAFWLRQMAEVGLLGRYLPAFGGCIGKIQYGMFREFSLDEHVLLSVEILSDILHDRDDGRYKLSKPMAAELNDPVALYLVLICAEASAGLIEPTAENVALRVRESVTRVLGENDPRVDFVVQSVLLRDVLMRTMSRRDGSDPGTIMEVSERIPSETHLKYLVITSTCRYQTAGKLSWEEYAQRDVRTLIEGMVAYYRGGMAGIDAYLSDRRKQLRQQTRFLLSEAEQSMFDQFILRTDSKFWSMSDVATAAELARLTHSVDTAGRQGGAVVRPHGPHGVQIIVYAPDERRHFSHSAGLVAAIGGSVVHGSAFGLAGIDGGAPKAALIFETRFQDRGSMRQHLTVDEQVELTEKFIALAEGGDVTISPPALSIHDRRQMFRVEPEIRFDRHSHRDGLVVEVEALDRPGLLYALAGALADIGFGITHAFVSTIGHRAVDTFYLSADDAPDGIEPSEQLIKDVLWPVIAPTGS